MTLEINYDSIWGDILGTRSETSTNYDPGEENIFLALDRYFFTADMLQISRRNITLQLFASGAGRGVTCLGESRACSGKKRECLRTHVYNFTLKCIQHRALYKHYERKLILYT